MAETLVDIERTFVDLPDNELDFDQAQSYFSGRSQLSWQRLLESDRVLIVSEAGVGKTVECKQQQERLWQAGEPAFYIELSVLATAPLVDQLTPEERERLEQWKSAQGERATFFFDSIDELKLTPAAFDFALKRIASELGARNLDRARVVLTTRPVPLDRELIGRRLPFTEQVEAVVPEEYFANVAMRVEKREKEKKSPPTWRTVALSPLTKNQMRTLAAHSGVADPDRLLAAVEAANAEEFTKRPLDFLELCGDWKAHARIRSHKEQIANNIEAKLRPSGERIERASLTPDRAREGVRRLALAALLTRRFTIWHGRDADRSRGDSALDPARILTDWTADEVQTLLERPLFGFATYGRVRFHHRSVIEFLAAERLQWLTAKGMSAKTLGRLLFTTTPVGLDVVKPTMAPVAAWLASENSSVRSEVLRRDPSLLLRMGDPSALDFAARKKALELYVDRYGPGKWRGEDIPALQIRRLASSDLAETVQALWSPAVENPEVRETLLQLIGVGRLSACADIAFEAAQAPAFEIGTRLYGLVSLAQLGDARFGDILDAMATSPANWPKRLISGVVAHLYPELLADSELIRLLALLGPKPHRGSGVSYTLHRAIAAKTPSVAELACLREGIDGMVRAGAAWNEPKHEVVTARVDLVPALLTITKMQIDSGAVGSEWADSTALALMAANHDVYAVDEVTALRQKLATASSTVRGSVFFANDRLIQEMVPAKHDSRFVKGIFHGPVDLDWRKDKDWLVDALADVGREAKDREFLLEVCQWLINRSVDALGELKELRSAVADAPTISAKLEELIKRSETPAAEPSWQREQRRRTEESKRKHAKNLASWRQFWREIAANPESMFSPERSDNTAYDLWRAMRAAGLEGSGWNRGFIERVFDASTADRLREALKARWRQEKPTVRSERAPDARDTYLVIWSMGLAGIYAEAENPGWATSLDPSEVELAARYALIEANELPAWVDDLIEVNPKVVEELIGNELDAELNDPAVKHSMLLQNVSNGSHPVIQLFLPRARAFFSKALTAAPQVPDDKTSRVIELLIANGAESDLSDIAAIASGQLAGSPSQHQMLFWLPVLMQLDPSTALGVMERAASSVVVAKHSVVTEWFSALFNRNARGMSSGTPPLAEDPALLLRALRLANKHIRFSDDVEHEGAYSPDVRDHAEHARSVLTNMLLNASGVEAWNAKVALAHDPNVAHFRDRAMALANQRMAEEWDSVAFDEARVVQLERQYEFPPTNRADMAGLLADRLSDIDDLLLQDASPRESWTKITQERLIRREVARTLEQMSRSSYHVNQEAVTGDEKETDIRLRSTASPLEGVIELKVAEQNYTIRDYESALRDQLVGKYMAPEDRRVGCLLISISTDRNWIHPDNGRKMGLEDVLTHLNEIARELVQDLGADAFLTVKALDLRPRDLSKPAK